ncbi:MAG: hypothetical protein J7513_15025 [Solirubrobacteraceae bacterium]|nr:hypothetical protein [Solirubrobacteraceae bacterium]
MQNTASIHTTTAEPKRSPGRSRRTTAALLAGPIVATAGLVATPWESEKSIESYHQALAGSPDQAQIAALLLYFGYALLGLSAFTAIRRMKSRHRKHVAVAAVLSYLGATLMPGQLVTDFYDLAMAQNLPAADAARASEATQELAFAPLMMIPALLGFVFGPVAVAALAAREKLVGWWAPFVFVAGFIVPIAIYSPAAIVVGGLALIGVYSAIAAGLARRDREIAEADAPAEQAGPVWIGAPAPEAW